MIDFQPFSSAHLIVILLTVLMALLVGVLSYRYPHSRQSLRITLLLLMIMMQIGVIMLMIERGITSVLYVLPLHLCDLVLLIVLFALLLKRQILFELAYFYGLAGATQAILTPDLAGLMPLWRFVYFFGAHAIVIVGIVYMITGLGMKPNPGAVKRAMLGLVAYTIIAGLVNAIAGTNYGYLRAKPQGGSIMDYMGPWPWYILVMGVFALVCFTALMLPFRGTRAADKT